MVDKKRIENAVKEILEAIGEDVYREGLIDTPARVSRMYEELTQGYEQNPSEPLAKIFHEKGTEIVIEKDIAFSSLCEHHLMPFFGKVHIAYIPNDCVVGLSKLARVVDIYAKRLQLQERLNQEIAQAILDELHAKGVLVIVEAEHTCMTARGVKKIGSKTLSYVTLGDISKEMEDRLFFLMGMKNENV